MKNKKVWIILGIIVLFIVILYLFINREKLVVVADVTHTTEDVYLDYLFDQVSEVEGISVDEVDFDGLTFNERINYAIDKVKASLIVAYASSKEMKMFAENYKDVIFITLGANYDEKLDNLVGVKYNVYNAGYLMGYVAGKTTQSNKIGFIGTDEEIDKEFLTGYTDGALESNSAVTISVDYMGKEYYVNGYYQDKSEEVTDEELSYNIATEMYNSGVDVIFENVNNSSGGISKSALENNKFVISDCMNESENMLACFERDFTYGLSKVVKNYSEDELENNYVFDINNGVNVNLTDEVSEEIKTEILEIQKEM